MIFRFRELVQSKKLRTIIIYKFEIKGDIVWLILRFTESEMY